ncbi:MAG: valine--tRNA ligase [Oscillospiraceae bacterium]|jgi:valyl-tRNA synthetase|nr:valine--tRNA ligase [Oscillospiraceae bacterium]
MKKELAKQYEPSEVEARIYQSWLEKDCFRAERTPGGKPYTIVIPPPNVTGQLHMGHALDETLQDILIRWRRMQGYDTLWLPGVDHAAISTEAKIVAEMAQEGLTKEDIGYEKFMERAWRWKEKYGGRILAQLRALGSSCDWSRERFTMDEGCSRAVREVFYNLYQKGLIYRGERIINWCPCCQTSLSDAEVEHEDREGAFWHIRYPFAQGDGFILVATTRPETMLGDTAVAVHPEDGRYAAQVGRMLRLPLTDREIPLVADAYVETDFGTGAVKITPAHDPNDFEVGRRHGLPVRNVMTEDGHMNENAGIYAGMDRYECRKAVVAALEAQGLLLKTEPTRHAVGVCYRCRTVVEPRVSLQWFVKMQPLAVPAIAAVREGTIRFVPERFEKNYLRWMENLRDWCISRQIWWGHRIPVWYCDSCGAQICAKEDPAGCPHCGAALRQDPDTLDTWFSSALWPFSTLGWPEKTSDLDYFYPTSTLVTGYDIITFWVSRMIFSGLEHTGRAPFSTVLVHGLIRDAQGRKMSKSMGNGIDPLDIIAQYGTDALRFALATGNSPGNDMRFSEEKVAASRNFANKLWNAARFLLMHLPADGAVAPLPETLALEDADAWILSRQNTLVREVTESLEAFELGIAAQKLYDFLWDEFCDWYIELSKPRLQGGGEAAGQALAVLVFVFGRTLQLLHPFMPFLTEEIWGSLPRAQGGAHGSIMLSRWPEYDESRCFPVQEARLQAVMGAIRAVRNRRSEMNVPPSRRAKLFIETAQPEIYAAAAVFFQRLAGASAVELAGGGAAPPKDAVRIVCGGATISIPLGELVDLAAERARLEKELAGTEKQLNGIRAKLGSEGFLSKAPAQVVQAQRENAAQLEEKAAALRETLRAL